MGGSARYGLTGPQLCRSRRPRAARAVVVELYVLLVQPYGAGLQLYGMILSYSGVLAYG